MEKPAAFHQGLSPVVIWTSVTGDFDTGFRSALRSITIKPLDMQRSIIYRQLVAMDRLQGTGTTISLTPCPLSQLLTPRNRHHEEDYPKNHAHPALPCTVRHCRAAKQLEGPIKAAIANIFCDCKHFARGHHVNTMQRHPSRGASAADAPAPAGAPEIGDRGAR